LTAAKEISFCTFQNVHDKTKTAESADQRSKGKTTEKEKEEQKLERILSEADQFSITI
jgi:hypothetical protein